MELLIFVLVAFLVWNLGALLIVLNRDKWLGHIDFLRRGKVSKEKVILKVEELSRNLIQNDPNLTLKGLQQKLKKSRGTIKTIKPYSLYSIKPKDSISQSK